MSTAENVADLNGYRKRKQGEGSQVLADTDNGFLRIANQIRDMQLKSDLSGAQFRVLLAIERCTYGYNKSEDRVTNSYLAELTDLSENSIINALKELQHRRIITVAKAGIMKRVSINKAVSEWVITTGKADAKAKGMLAVKQKAEQMLTETAQMLSTDHTNAQSLSHKCSDTKDNQPKTTNQIQHDLDPPPQTAAGDSEQTETITRPTAVIQQGKHWGEAIDVEVLEKMEALLQQRHSEHYRRPSKSVLASRANTIRLMRTHDQRKPEHILALFTLAQFDDFWCSNILCPNSLRKQWLKLGKLYQQKKAQRQAQSEQASWTQQAFNPEDPLV